MGSLFIWNVSYSLTRGFILRLSQDSALCPTANYTFSAGDKPLPYGYYQTFFKNIKKHIEITKSLWYYSLAPDKKVHFADIAQSVERILGKDEVTGSNPVISSKSLETLCFRAFCFI